MFFSISNHRVSSWPEKQILSAGGMDNIVDMSFPQLTGDDDEHKVAEYVKNYLDKIPIDNSLTVFVAGEYCFVFALINALKKRGQKVVFANANIKLEYFTDAKDNCNRKITYSFENFREYEIYPKDVKFVIKRNPVLLNCSINYPIANWDKDTIDAATKIGEPKDYLISVLDGIDAKANMEKVNKYLNDIDEIAPSGIILDGHFYTFYMMAEVLMRKGYDIYVKCGDRKTVEKISEDEKVEKMNIYKFKRFRKLFVL